MRDTWGELVERRLWPVALLLVVALVAVPLVLAKQPGAGTTVAGEATPAGAASSAGAPSAPASGEPVVSVAQGPGAAAPILGRAKDPFKQQFVPARAAGTKDGGTPPTSGGTGANGGAGSGGSGSGSGGAGSGGSQPKTYTYASVDARFGRAGSPLTDLTDVPRLAPLPSAADPVVIFMGTRADHETAVFMVSTDVHAQGEGRCVPSKKDCEAIELRRGDVALLDVTAADGSVTQYELDLVDVALHQTTSQAKASAANARVSRAGRALVRRRAATSAIVSALRYSAATGVLTPVPGTYLEREGGAPAGDPATPQAAAGTASAPPVLTPLP